MFLRIVAISPAVLIDDEVVLLAQDSRDSTTIVWSKNSDGREEVGYPRPVWRCRRRSGRFLGRSMRPRRTVGYPSNFDSFWPFPRVDNSGALSSIPIELTPIMKP